jgi:non-specific serine/threonine protein kinase
MGEVYRARDGRLERDVAIKVLPEQVAGDRERRARFERETKLLAVLSHPNILTIFDVGVEGDTAYAVMELLEGETLRSRLSRGALSWQEAALTGIALADGLAAAHSRGVIHRDLKPENIFLLTDGRTKILDFGLARQTSTAGIGPETSAAANAETSVRTPLHTRAGAILGTLGYLSPEQVRGLAVDGRSDIFSLGCVVFEMVSGRRAFERATAADTLVAILSEAPPDIRELGFSIPGALAELISRCLEKSPERRIPSAHQVSSHLKAISSGLGAPISPAPAISLPPTNLPLQLTSFVGRKKQVEQVSSLLSRHRLVTLTGPAGAGKTRLALRVASELLPRYEHGAYFVDLAPLRDAEVVDSTIARTLGVEERPGEPVLGSLKAHLREKRVLLVLDNFEQILVSAPIAQEILRECAGVRILVTSREPLHLQGEQEFPVPPLAQSESVELFLHRAQAARPNFSLDAENAGVIADVCLRLEGLPLAIELAAARAKVLSPRDLLGRLDYRIGLLTSGAKDLPARQQTMRAAIAWSEELLRPEEKDLFRRLSIFLGGFDLEAAMKVGSRPKELDIDALEGVASLVDKSLLQVEESGGEESRYRMLEMIREFGLERLEDSGEGEAVREAHADFFLRLSESLEAELTGPKQTLLLDRLERDHDNFRAAFDWSSKSAPGVALRLAAALWRLWLVRGYFAEGRKWLSSVLSSAPSELEPEARAQALIGAGTLAHNQGDYQRAREAFEAALGLWRRLDRPSGIATTLNHLGWLAWRLGEFAQAQSLSEEALLLHRELGNEGGVATSLNNLAWVAHYQGEFSLAERLLEECLVLHRQRGDSRNIAFAQTNLAHALLREGEPARAAELLQEARGAFEQIGEKQLWAYATAILAEAAHDEGDYPRAEALSQESLFAFRRIGDEWGIAFTLNDLGRAARAQGDLARAAQLYRDSLSLSRQSGAKWPVARCLQSLGELAVSKGDLLGAKNDCRESLRLRREMKDKLGVAECLEALGAVAATTRRRCSAWLFGAAERIRHDAGAPLPRYERGARDSRISALRASLGDERFTRAWARGYGTALDKLLRG